MISTKLHAGIHEAMICLSEFLREIDLSDEQYRKSEKITCLLSLMFDALLEGDTEFSWQKTHDKGRFSEYTYDLFSQELKDAGVDITKGKFGKKISSGIRPKTADGFHFCMNAKLYAIYDMDIVECQVVQIKDPNSNHKDDYEDGKRWEIIATDSDGAEMDLWNGDLYSNYKAAKEFLNNKKIVP